MAAVKSGLRARVGKPVAEGSRLTWRATDGSVIEVSGTPDPDLVDPDAGCLGWDVVVAPGEHQSLVVSVQRHGAVAASALVYRRGGFEGEEVAVGKAFVEAGDQRLAPFLARSLADLDGLQMSMSVDPDDIFAAAGVPWFLTLFGRDSIWAARMLLPLGSDLALGTSAPSPGARAGSSIT